MQKSSNSIPLGHSLDTGTLIHSSVELGLRVREQRKRLGMKQLDIAGLGNTGNRFIVELEKGKPTLQFQKVLDVVELLGLELIVRPKGSQRL